MLLHKSAYQQIMADDKKMKIQTRRDRKNQIVFTISDETMNNAKRAKLFRMDKEVLDLKLELALLSILEDWVAEVNSKRDGLKILINNGEKDGRRRN